jgi:hypothetical protein
MKLEIKSVLIGVLLGINIMLLMGSAPVDNERNGKYAPVYHEKKGKIIIVDTTNGRYETWID